MADPEKILKVSVVTPDGIVYSHNATMVAMRAIDGERTIMYDHLPIVTPLAIGEVRVKRTHEMIVLTTLLLMVVTLNFQIMKQRS